MNIYILCGRYDTPRVLKVIFCCVKAAESSERLIHFYQTARCHSSEESGVHNHDCENLIRS
jgi:hypothetical protein